MVATEAVDTVPNLSLDNRFKSWPTLSGEERELLLAECCAQIESGGREAVDSLNLSESRGEFLSCSDRIHSTTTDPTLVILSNMSRVLPNGMGEEIGERIRRALFKENTAVHRADLAGLDPEERDLGKKRDSAQYLLDNLTLWYRENWSSDWIVEKGGRLLSDSGPIVFQIDAGLRAPGNVNARTLSFGLGIASTRIALVFKEADGIDKSVRHEESHIETDLRWGLSPHEETVELFMLDEICAELDSGVRFMGELELPRYMSMRYNRTESLWTLWAYLNNWSGKEELQEDAKEYAEIVQADLSQYEDDDHIDMERNLSAPLGRLVGRISTALTRDRFSRDEIVEMIRKLRSMEEVIDAIG